MKERPIIFNTELVKAILAGQKTQSRRVIKPQPVLGRHWKHGWVVDPAEVDIPIAFCPYGIPGDSLWVREIFYIWQAAYLGHPEQRPIAYAEETERMNREPEGTWKKRPSIFMPRWASRITLEITGVCVEQLQDISEEDAAAEGVNPIIAGSGHLKEHWHRAAFGVLWDDLNAKRGLGWDTNPWVWRIEFRQAE